MEIGLKAMLKTAFTLFKTYKVCMQSGSIGPKRSEGDNQVPEGFYYINEFNPNSNYHLSLGLNYPNASDKMLSAIQNIRVVIFIFMAIVYLPAALPYKMCLLKKFTILLRSQSQTGRILFRFIFFR